MSDVYTKYTPGYEKPPREDVSRPDPADRLVDEAKDEALEKRYPEKKK